MINRPLSLWRERSVFQCICRDKRYEWNRQDHTKCCGNSLDDFDTDGIHVQYLIILIIIAVYVDKSVNGTSGKSKNQGIGHSSHHIFSDVDSRMKKFFPVEVGIFCLDFWKNISHIRLQCG